MTTDNTKPPSRIVTSRAGYQRLLDKLQEAKRRYDVVCASNEEAAGAGDSSVWHDNFAYEDNQRQMHQLARRVRDLQHLLSVAEIADPPADPAHVSFGCVVELLDISDDQPLRLIIGGWEDSDPTLGRIAYNTPLASALIGAEEGDVRICPGAHGKRQLEICAIRTADAKEL
jgi:transcription elongation GreA/GreB family factor